MKTENILFFTLLLCAVIFGGALLFILLVEPQQDQIYNTEYVVSIPQQATYSVKQEPEVDEAQLLLLKKLKAMEEQQMYGYNSRAYSYNNGYYGYNNYDNYYTPDYRENYYDDSIISNQEYDLTIRVRDEDNDNPIEDAKVRIENSDDYSKYTDEDGYAKFRSIEKDCYDIDVSADGYNSESDDICLSDDEKLNIRLNKRD